ncbi:MAG: SulP family inorganic anion transporter [Candidatus Omnitrophica bacterium]|nr:SulP family inorganic anion transporter [Candidatus Omnitrophota bacterium]
MDKKTFEPKIITVFKEGYTLSRFFNDLFAGLIVGIVALPLSIAFAIASGVKPEQGLVTAFVGGFLISLLSGSRVQIGGPTGAFIIIVFSVVQQYGYEGLATATLLAGIFLVIMGFLRLGDAIKYIPYPVTIGFTSGIAMVIFVSQIPDFFGFHLEKIPTHFVDKIITYLQNVRAINIYSVVLSIITILIIVLWPKVTKRLPGTIVAILVTTFFVHWLRIPVETIAGRFGEVSHSFPIPCFPHLNFGIIVKLVPIALTIAILAGIESLLSAVVADGMLGTRHRSNMELVGQGVANIVSPVFGGIPVTGAIARTATNIKNGGRTPVAGIVHALVILFIFIFCAKWAGFIPMATLAGILISVAYNMSELQHFRRLLSGRRGDVLVLLLTFGLTVFVDLTVAIEVGVVLAAFLFMHRMAEITNIKLIGADSNGDHLHEYTGVPKGIEIFEINGPFFFGAVNKFRDAIASFEKPPQVIILRMSAVPAVDVTAVNALETFIKEANADGTEVVFAGVNRRVYNTLNSFGIVEHIGIENILADVGLALAQAVILMNRERQVKHEHQR